MAKKTLRGFIVSTLWLLIASGVSARDIYVDNVAGDDTRDGSSPVMVGRRGGPCSTIAKALRIASHGDRIILANSGEHYRESVTLQAERHSGLPNRPFLIVGNGAVLDGSRPVPKEAWEHVVGDVYRFRPPRMSYQVLYLDGQPATRRPVGEDGELPSLEPREWCLHERHICFRTDEGKFPREYNLSYTALPVGITLYEVRNVVVTDLIVQGYQLDGVNAHDGVFDSHLVGLTCRGNGRSGISVGGASRVTISACLVGDNGAAQVRTEGFSRTQLRNCDLVETSAPGLVREGGLVTMLTDDGDP